MARKLHIFLHILFFFCTFARFFAGAMRSREKKAIIICLTFNFKDRPIGAVRS